MKVFQAIARRIDAIEHLIEDSRLPRDHKLKWLAVNNRFLADICEYFLPTGFDFNPDMVIDFESSDINQIVLKGVFSYLPANQNSDTCWELNIDVFVMPSFNPNGFEIEIIGVPSDGDMRDHIARRFAEAMVMDVTSWHRDWNIKHQQNA